MTNPLKPASRLAMSEQPSSASTEQAAKLELIGNGTLMALAMTTLMAFATAWLLWSPARSGLVVGWCSMMAVVQLLRLWMWRRYRLDARNKQTFEPQYWTTRLRATLLATGVLWGVAGMLLMPPEPGLEQVFVTTLILGICASATSWLAVERTGFLLLVVPALSGLAVGYLRVGGEMAWLIAPLIALFGVFMVSNGKRARDQFRALRNLDTQLSADREQVLRLSRVASQAAYGVAVVDLEGRVDWINEGFSRLLGYSIEQLRGRRLARSVVGRATNLASVEKLVEAFRNGEIRQEDLQLQSRSGRYVWGRVQVSPIEDESGEIVEFLCAVADISKEMNARMALEEHLQALHELAELASDPGLDTEARVQRVLELSYSVLGFESATICRLRERKLEVEFASGNGDSEISPGARAALVGTLAEKVLDAEETVWIEDVQALEEGPRSLFDGVHCRSYVGHPLYLPDHSMRVIGFAGSLPMNEAISQRKRVFLEICIQYIAGILEQRAQTAELNKLAKQVPGMIYQFQLMPDGTMRFPFSSPGSRDIFGLDSAELTESAEKLFAKIHPHDRPALYDSIEKSAANLSLWEHEHRVVESDGGIKWLHAAASPESLGDGSILWHGYVKDISERKLAAIALERNERRLRALFELTPLGIVLNDVKTGAFVQTNQRFQVLTGFDEQKLTEKRFADLCSPEFLEQDNQYLTSLLRGGDLIPYERPMLRADGTSFIARMHSAVLQDGPEKSLTWTLVEDVTESRQLEEELRSLTEDLEARVGSRTREVREASERTAMIIEASQDGFVMQDKQGRVLEVNQAFCKLLQMPENELVGQTGSKKFLVDYEPGRTDELFNRIQQAGSLIFERRLRRSDGKIVEVEVSASICKVDNEDVAFSFIRDISSRKKVERQLRQAKLEAEKASNAKSEFLSHMSHELRTPLNAILGFSQLLEADPTLEENSEQRDNVVEIRKAGEHLLDEVNEILDLNRVEQGRIEFSREVMLLAPVVKECVSMMGVLAGERQVKLHVEIDEGLEVCGDPNRLRQVIVNLLGNAVKYNKEAGSVWIQAEQNDSAVRLAVVDTGPGIEKSAQKRLFKPFERLDADSMDIDGTGIGLVLSKKLVEGMGGEIGVTSTPGKGSTFWVTLPGARESRDRLGSDSNSDSLADDGVNLQGSVAHE